MKKALIDTLTSVSHIVSWSGNDPIYETYANSARVCEVTNSEFPVYKTLIWVDCEDEVVADQYYYDTETQAINIIEDAPQPVEPTE